MSNDPVVGGDADAAAAVIAVMEGGKTANDNVDSGGGDLVLEEEEEEESGTRALVGQFQDARKGATLYSDFTYRDDPPHENNNINLRAHHHYDEDYDYDPDHHGDLGPSNSRNGRGRYLYSFVRSRTFRRCAVGVLAVGAIIGMIVGIVKSQQKKRDLPDWEGMLAEEQQQQQGGGSTTTVPQQPILPPQVPTPPKNQIISQEMMKEYQESGLKYHPVWFARGDGWNGQTYDDAAEFCAMQDRESIICPYDAICPLGINLMPLGGAQKGAEPTGSTWAPIDDGVNNWVQVGDRDSWCEKLLSPLWGVTGEGSSEGFTRHVACCKVPTAVDDTTVPSSSSNSIQIEQEIGEQMTNEKYDGVWFDRTTGWMGANYFLATSFCAKQGFMTICPYEAYCPEGADGAPIGGVKVGFRGERDQWAPIGDKKNGWVQVGPDNSCVKRSDWTEESAAWEFTIEGSQMVTQHVMCCPVAGVHAGNSDAVTQEEAATSATVPPPAPTMNTIKAEQENNSQMAMVNDNGVWFDRTTGWVDSDYYMAMSFCAQQGLMVVCPYEAYCPDGADGVPLGGVKVGEGGEQDQWAPIGNKKNEWVQVGPDNSCVKRTDMTEMSPQWEFTAEGSHMVTQHIMCCPVFGAQAGNGNAITQEAATSETVPPPPPPTPASAPTPAVEVTAEAKKAQFDWAAEAYEPEWFDRNSGWTGSNYVEAIDFCKQQQGRTICPYEAYCPMTKSVGSEPFGGSKSEYSWAPIDDSENWWVQVSGTDTCQLFNEMNGGPPSWGMGGKNELETRYVLCCKQPDAGMNDADYYHSSMADETDTQTEVVIAKDECKDHPTAIITPQGQTCDTFISHVGRVNLHNARCGHETALKDENGETLLIKDVCRLSCGACGGVWPLPPPVATPVEQPPPPPTPASAPTPAVEVTAEAKKAQFDWAAEAYEPEWFDRNSGWTGSNYVEAIDFCKQQQGRTICPYEAYCPMTKSVGSEPFGGSKSEYSWAPIDDSENWWVQVSGTDTCQLFNEMNGGPPSWGMGGKNELETRYVLCCKQPDAGMNDADYYHSSMADETDTQTEVVIAKDECKDHPTAIITPQGQTCDTFITHVGRVNLHNARCSHETALKDENGETLLIKDVCRLSCGACGDVWPLPPPVATPVEQQQTAQTVAVNSAMKRMKMFDRDSGWEGSSYSEALMFCGSKRATVCPYESYCPQGPGSSVMGDAVSGSQWAPFINIANGWVQIGTDATCMPYNSLNSFPPEWGLTGSNKAETSHIMCCEPDENWIPADQVAKVTLSSAPSEIDKMAMDMFKPIWFERKHGWNGGSHADAEKFCNNIGDMELCPAMALCPDGGKLFNDKQPFPGEQWVPLNDGDWTFVGAGGNTCQQYHVLNNKPSSDVDSMPEAVKQHMMCCAKSREAAGEQNLEEVLKGSMEPTWYSRSDGWNGGSHSDAIDFCQQEGKKLCPYVGYCPYGEGSQAFPGHPIDFNTESVQWSPWAEGTGEGWVMVSQKYQNSATTCMTYKDLEGGIPPWEDSDNFAEAKKYVLCCNTRNPPAQPINPLPAPVPSPPVTPQAPLLPQEVKWYPQANADERKCVQGNDYDSSFATEGWVYETETECCDAWGLHCGEKTTFWYPALVNEEQMCVEGSDYESSILTSGWLFVTEENCCEAMLLDCSPVKQKWHPKLVDGQKSCVLGVSDSRSQYESEEECCAAFPEACVTTTITTTSAATRPSVSAPPCQPSGGKGCHWWPKLQDMTEITCIYSSNWPTEAADHLYGDFDSCYCTYHDC